MLNNRVIAEKIPGLGPLIEKISDSISGMLCPRYGVREAYEVSRLVFVFTTLEPFLKPLMKQATNGLQTASGEVIDSHDQYEASMTRNVP